MNKAEQIRITTLLLAATEEHSASLKQIETSMRHVADLAAKQCESYVVSAAVFRRELEALKKQ